MLRLIPLLYVIIALVLLCSKYYHKAALGTAIVTVEGYFFSRQNSNGYLGQAALWLIPYFTYIFELFTRWRFERLEPEPYEYLAVLLMLFFIAYYLLEKRTIREKGITSPNGHWQWSDIASYYWDPAVENVVIFNITRGGKPQDERWHLRYHEKDKVNLLLELYIPREKPEQAVGESRPSPESRSGKTALTSLFQIRKGNKQ